VRDKAVLTPEQAAGKRTLFRGGKIVGKGWLSKMRSFPDAVLQGPKEFVKGGELELEAMAG
jgi:hypothetical protein